MTAATAPATAPKKTSTKKAKATPQAAKPEAAAPAQPAAPTAKKKAKAEKVAKPPREKARKVSALDAAAQVLAASKKPLRATELIAEMESRGLWKSPGGKTPEATLYAAMTREISQKKGEARFKKVDRGLFTAGKGA